MAVITLKCGLNLSQADDGELMLVAWGGVAGTSEGGEINSGDGTQGIVCMPVAGAQLQNVLDELRKQAEAVGVTLI